MHSNVPTLSDLASRKIAIERILVLLLNADKNSPSLNIRNTLIDYILLGGNSKKEKLLQMLGSDLLAELDRFNFPSDMRNSMLSIPEEMLVSEGSFFYSFREIVQIIKSSGQNISRDNIEIYLNKIANDIQAGNIQVSNAGIDVVSVYQELAHLNLSDTEKLVFNFLAGNEFREATLLNDQISSLFQIDSPIENVRLTDLLIVSAKKDRNAQEQLFTQISRLLVFINEREIINSSRPDAMQKLHYSILRSAVGSGLESFANRFIREEGEKLGGLDILKFAFLEALDEGRVSVTDLIWKSELFSSQERRSMFKEIVQRGSFSVAAIRGDVDTLSWLWKYSDNNTRRSMIRKHGYFAFQQAAVYGKVDVLDWLWNNAIDEQSAMFGTKDYDNTLGTHSSDEVVKWFLDHASNGKTRLDILIKFTRHVQVWSDIFRRFGLRVSRDTLTALESDGSERKLAEQIIGEIVSSDDIEALNLLWENAKELNKRANILNINNYYSNFKESVRSGHIRILNWILEHINEINIAHQNMLQLDEYGVVNEAVRSGNTEVFEWIWKYAHAIGGNEEQRKMLKANNYSIFQEAVKNNNIQMLFQLLNYAAVGNLLTLDERIQAISVTGHPNAFLFLFTGEGFIEFSSNNDDNYIPLLDKFFNSAKSFGNYASFIQTNILGIAFHQAEITNNAKVVAELQKYFSELPEYNNETFKEHVNFIFDYTRSIVPALHNNNNCVSVFEKFFNDSSKFGDYTLHIRRSMLIAVFRDAEIDTKKTAVIDLLEHISNLPEYVDQKQFIDSTLLHARSSMHTQFVSMNPEIAGPSGLQGRKVGDYIFARSGNDLIITNAFNSNLEICTISLSNFYQEAKMQTLTIKFIDKEILLKNEIERINNANTISEQLEQHKNATYNSVFNKNITTNINSIANYKRKRRDESTVRGYENNNDQALFYGQNNANSSLKGRQVASGGSKLSSTNSGSRPSFWITDFFGRIKNSIVGFIAPSKEQINSNIQPEISSAFVDGFLILSDVGVRKFTGNKYKQPKHDPFLSPKELIERRMDYIAINAINNFEKVCDDRYDNDFQNATNKVYDQPMTCLNNLSLANTKPQTCLSDIKIGNLLRHDKEITFFQ